MENQSRLTISLDMDYSVKIRVHGDNFMKQKMMQVLLLSLERITMHLLSVSKNLLLILIHTLPFLQMEKCLLRILLEATNIQ